MTKLLDLVVTFPFEVFRAHFSKRQIQEIFFDNFGTLCNQTVLFSF